MLADITYILSLSVKVFGAYFIFIMLFSVLKSKPFKRRAPKTKFAVLIPARNEESVIGNLIQSIQLQDYPGELYDIYVIPNNCTDDTKGAALRAGAKVIECMAPVTCKGDAMRQAFRTLLREDHDAYCVFDADNYADQNFLKEMNNALSDGYHVAKGRTEARNPYDSWVSGCYGLYFNTFNMFFNRARANLGLSAKLVGTAFAVSRSLIEKNDGWNTVTLTEDAEFAAQCAIIGERVAWVPNAVAYDEEPLDFTTSFRQRRRWISGIMQVAAIKLPKQLRAFKGKGWQLRIDGMMILTAPFVQGISLFPILLSAYAAICGGAAANGAAFLTFVSGVAMSYAGATLGAFAIALLARRYDARIAKSVFMYGPFMFSWIPIATISLFKKKATWEQISHGHTLQTEMAA